MGANTKIEWCHHTFNPWWGCMKVSPGCAHCYAETLARRTGRDVWGPTVSRWRTTDANWREPLKWDKAANLAGTRARVFCASMADVFEARPELDEWRIDLWRLILETPNLDWLLLTKRPENVLQMVPPHWREQCGPANMPANIWIGTSVENQETADERIHHLLHIPARVRFLSVEPLLGPVDLRRVQFDPQITLDALTGDRTTKHNGTYKTCDSLLNWVIVGGESGHHARPMHPAWAQSLRDQCQAAGVSFFFKQWGEWALKGSVVARSADFGVLAPAGDWYHQHTGWNGRPIDPDTGEAYMLKVGKASAGRVLDGREWNDVPQ